MSPSAKPATASTDRPRSVRPWLGTEPSKFHSDAVFLKAPLTAAKAMGVVSLKAGLDWQTVMKLLLLLDE